MTWYYVIIHVVKYSVTRHSFNSASSSSIIALYPGKPYEAWDAQCFHQKALQVRHSRDMIIWTLGCILVFICADHQLFHLSYDTNQREPVWRDVTGAGWGSNEEKAHSRNTPSSSTGFPSKFSWFGNQQQRFEWIYGVFKFNFIFSTAFGFLLLVWWVVEGIFSWKPNVFIMCIVGYFFFPTVLFVNAYN